MTPYLGRAPGYFSTGHDALGSAPRDLLLRSTQAAAKDLVARSKFLPSSQRAIYMLTELASLDPALPVKVEATLKTLLRKGYSDDAAMEKAIEIESANSLIGRVVAAGQSSVSGLGASGADKFFRDAGRFASNLTQGAVCSGALRDLIVDRVGTGSGREAAMTAQAGADALRSAAGCGAQPQPTPAAPPVPSTPSIPPPAPPSIPIWPFVIGGAVLIGVVVFAARR
jgi:hypothetical protein